VKHDVLTEWASVHNFSLDSGKKRKLDEYARLLHEANQRFNLTGITNIDEILNNLILGSIEPFIWLNVPRGTIYADIGSGAGIPGIPLGIFHSNMQGILIESNNKKSSFISSVIKELELENCRVYHGRIEEYQKEVRREQFDIVFSRALGDPYYVIELGAPLLKKGGALYIYSNLKPEDLPGYLMDHIVDLGLSSATDNVQMELGISDNGLLFIKTGNTDRKFPRKISIIKRDISRNLKIGLK
jgi:16S rRNA (guanine527-N7)-methyltransferase